MGVGNIDLTIKPQSLELFIAKPNTTIVGKLKHFYKAQTNVKLGNISELTFTVPYEVDIHHKLVRNPAVDWIQDRCLIKAIYNNESDWYIVKTKVDSMDGDANVMEITAFSRPHEMADKSLHLFQEDAVNLQIALWGGTAYDAAGNAREITGILSKTLWKMGFIDADFLTTFRSFDMTSTTVLDALLQVADTFNALIVWDNDKRIIHLYNGENYGVNRGLTLNYGHYLKSVSRESRSDEMTTRYHVFGKDDLSIQRVNLTGQNYIEDYSYFLYPFKRDEQRQVLQHSSYMSDELCHAILDFTGFLQANEGEFAASLDQLKPLQVSLSSKQVELDTLNNDLTVIVTNLDLANYNGDSTSQLIADKANKESQIAAKQTEITALNLQIENMNSLIQTLRAQFEYSNFFTPELLEELNNYIVEKEWSDTNYTDDAELLAAAKKNFESLKQPKVVFNIDAVDFLSVVEAQRDWGKLKLGDTVNIRYEKMDILATAKIIEYTLDHEGSSLTFTIANTKELLSDEERLTKLIYASSSASNTLEVSKSKWDGVEDTRSEVKDLLNNVWDATKRSIAASNTNSVEIGNRGVVTTDLNDEMKQVIIQAGQIALTGNGGNTWDTAINADGIYAKHLVGQILLGENLRIDASDENGRKIVSIDSTGMVVDGLALKVTGGLPPSQLDPAFKDSLVNLGSDYNGVIIDAINGLVVTNHTETIKTTLNATDGFTFETSNGTGWNKRLYYDAAKGNLMIDGEINARALKVQGVDVLTDDDKIKAGAIETLEVGKNVLMGPEATIDWDQISSKPYIPALPSYIQATKIGSTYIESPTITAGKITGAEINGVVINSAQIHSGTITSDTEINVGIDARIGNNLYLGEKSSGTRKSVVFNEGANIEGYTSTDGSGSSVVLYANYVVASGFFSVAAGHFVSFANTNVDFTGAKITGLSVTSTFG